MTNIGDKAEIITHLSSAALDGLGQDGLLPWYDKNRYVFHSCDSVWEGEAQWRHSSLHELCMVPSTTHFNMKTVSLRSTGSWTTARYYPMVILEDTETGKSFYLEIEPAGSWQIELYNPSEGFANDGSIGFEANCANFHNDGWFAELKPGESYTAKPCVYGYVSGGFEEAVADLLAYKRETSVAGFKGRIPVVFNCYMDCIGGNPTSENLIPLIDACAKAKVDVFCIDAGWFRGKDVRLGVVGDYEIAEDRFPGYGLQGIFDYMKSKNIIPGIWLEAERCDINCKAYNAVDDTLCKRHGKPIGENTSFFNFREPSVREHMMKVIDKLYSMGVRYIKNDYNQTTGGGFSNYGEAFSKESSDSIDAFLRFIDSVRQKYPDMIIENCGSGGMREDNNTLKHFELQSTSDQELFFRNPSIISGSLALMAPEKAGAWSYPYPVFFNSENRSPFNDVELWDKKRAMYADGEETIFNMVNGLIANLYMSGRIDKCDKLNFNLIKEGIKLYKSNSGFIKSAVPVWPLGTFSIDDEGMFCTGLINRKKGKMLLAVWNINAWKKTAVIDISKWAGKNSTARVCYPAADTASVCIYHPDNGKLSVSLPDVKYSARLIEIIL